MHTHTFPFSFIQKIGHKFARIPFDTVPHKSHAINIDFPLPFGIYMCFPEFWLLSGISVLSGLYMHRAVSLQLPRKSVTQARTQAIDRATDMNTNFIE